MRLYDVLTELCEYCISDELTLPTLQRKMKKLDQFTSRDLEAKYQHYPFFHNVCLSKRVSIEIVEYLLFECPDAATILSEDHDTKNTYPLHYILIRSRC